MNAKTAKLIRRYSASQDEPNRKWKRIWNSVAKHRRFALRRVMEMNLCAHPKSSP